MVNLARHADEAFNLVTHIIGIRRTNQLLWSNLIISNRQGLESQHVTRSYYLSGKKFKLKKVVSRIEEFLAGFCYSEAMGTSSEAL